MEGNGERSGEQIVDWNGAGNEAWNGIGNGAENRSSIGTERGTKRGTEWGTEGEVGEDSKFFQCSLLFDDVDIDFRFIATAANK